MQFFTNPVSPSPREVVIVGAGPGGLASAILLATAGVRVRILERLPIVGGRTSTPEADGFKFDLGPTFFLYARILDEILRGAGTSLEAEVELVRLDPQYRLTFGSGGTLECTPDRAEMERQIRALAPNDAPGFGRFLDDNRRKLALMQPCLESSFSGWGDILQTRLLKLLPMLRPHQSIDGYLRRFFSDERVRLAFLSSRNISGCRPFAAQVSSRFFPSSNTSTASSIRSAAAARSRPPWPGSRAGWAWKSISTNRSRKSSSKAAAPPGCGPIARSTRRTRSCSMPISPAP